MTSVVRVEKNCPPSKVVIRRLPPSMTIDSFVDQISPVPENDYLHFVRADMSLGQYAFSRAYINFCNRDDIFVFKDKFDGYVFVDGKGAEYSSVVEFAPFPKVPKKKPKKVDAKCGTIEQDADYLKFLEGLKNPEEVNLPSAEFYLEEIENRERELRGANNGSRNLTTPLIEYLREKKAEKVRVREERREERRRRDVEKKRQKEEERRRKKVDRERERERNNARERTAREGKQAKMTEPAVKLLKNPERERPTKEADNETSSVQMADKDAVTSDSVTSHAMNKVSRREGGLGKQRQAPAIKDWNVEVDRERGRRREDVRSRDKPREYRRPKREQIVVNDEEQQRSPHAMSSAQEGTSAEKSKTSAPSRLSTTTVEWHRGAQRTIVTSSGNSSASSIKGKGKSYEKSRQESLASVKARSVLGKGKTAAVHSTKDDDDDDHHHHRRGGVNLLDERDLRTVEEDVKIAAKCDAEVAESFRRERSSRDPRTERRIRNKDRPSIELYRPGMRRMSQQWSSHQKESSSSSPSPTTVQQLVIDQGVDNDVHRSDKEAGNFPEAIEHPVLIENHQDNS